MIQFTLSLEPVAKGRPRFGNGRTFTPAATVRFERLVRMMSAPFRPIEKMRGPLSMEVTFVLRAPKRKVRSFPAVRPDLDNYAKAILDGLQDFWEDDGQVCELTARKIYAWTGEPEIRVRIQRITGAT